MSKRFEGFFISIDLSKRTITLKLCLVGFWGVGKTSLRRKFMGGRFRRSYLPTVGADFSFKEIEIDGVPYRLLTWDLAGESKFRNVRGLYFQGVFGCLVVFDLTNRDSFLNLDEWIQDIESSTNTNGVPLWILANKNDLIFDDEGPIKKSEIDEYVEKLRKKYEGRFDVNYSMTSAVTGENVDVAFTGLVKNIMEWLPKRRSSR
ncbi:MAG: Rab family GTPase [Candidatus Kariarchaeaceae archaeon]|jgi:small GTP-binding protein